MLYAQEADRTTVVHVDDVKKMRSYTNVTTPDQAILNRESAFKHVKQPTKRRIDHACRFYPYCPRGNQQVSRARLL